MKWTEQQLKNALRGGDISPLYLLYGDEPYFTAQYAKKIVKQVVPSDDSADFNLHLFDGDSFSVDELESVVQAAPFMGEYNCVWMREYDPASSNAQIKRIENLLTSVQLPSVLLFSVTVWNAEKAKSAKWKAFIAKIQKLGVSVFFERRTSAQTVDILCRGAKKRGCLLSRAEASAMSERCGEDLTLLLSELDKLCSVAQGGEITVELVHAVCAQRLEASVYELSKALLSRRYDTAYDVISRLFSLGEEPVRILAVLSESYVDLYRAKTASTAGITAENAAEVFSLKGREFRLRNAARDCRQLSESQIIKSLQWLALADSRMKGGSQASHRTLLDETVAGLIMIAKAG